MNRAQLSDLAAFVMVAQERSFTRAAAKLGLTQSSLSHTVRRLEAGLGLRLLARTTRSVAPTDAGERLLRTLGPAFEEIDAGLDALSELRDRPAGSIRITTAEHAAETLLMPALQRLLPQYPDIRVELVVDYGLSDVVAERYDAGVRLGEQVAKDMVAVRIGPDMRMAAVASPNYLATRPLPRAPQDLAGHRCINLRLPTSGGLYAWEFEKSGRELKVRVDGQLAVNDLPLSLEAARRGLGIAFVPQDIVQEDIRTGRLLRLLEDWCAPFAGYHLYYPSRRQPTPAFALLVEALRYRAPPAGRSARPASR
ncbi:MAG TPA: LysR family transcriptional regulator [Steroidobacteraceae bacterium]|nr:LysR family transcriptional regulator [Steroidobacteraceae bacterium]